MRRYRVFVVISIMSLAVLLSACAPQPEPSLTIAAASSLTSVLTKLIESPEFGAEFEIITSFSSTGDLAEQIKNGAPFDLFLAADEAHLSALVEEGYIRPESEIIFATGRLAVIHRPGLDIAINSLEDLIDPSLKRIVIANPIHAPYGQVAAQVLREFGLFDNLEEKLIFAETVRQAALLVETGNADAGIVAKSVVPKNELLSFILPEDMHDPINHTLGILTEADHPDLAIKFIEIMRRPESVGIWRESGFEPLVIEE